MLMDKTEMIKEMDRILSTDPDVIAEKAKALFRKNAEKTEADMRVAPGAFRESWPLWYAAIDALPDTKGFLRVATNPETTASLDIIRIAAGINAPDS
jgi:hypothetical protein